MGAPIEAWPTPTWDLKTLSLAAWYFNPQLDEARANLSESQAALKTAGARPNPTLSVTPGIPSPYLLTLDLSSPALIGRADDEILDAWIFAGARAVDCVWSGGVKQVVLGENEHMIRFTTQMIHDYMNAED